MKVICIHAFLYIMLSSLISGATIAESAEVPKEQPETAIARDFYELLFIGNSHVRTAGLPSLIATMIETGLPGSTVGFEVAPGFDYLGDRLADGVTQATLVSRLWTHVILQAQKYSTSGQYHYPTDGTEEWIRRVHARNAEPILFPEWRRKGNTEEGLRVHNLHLGIAEREPACVAPVGLAWEESIRRYPTLDLHAADGNHANTTGATLTAFVFYQVITGQSAAELPFIRSIAVSESIQRDLREVAAEVVENNSETCTFNQDIPQSVDVKAGDVPGLIKAISEANDGTGPGKIRVIMGDSGETEFEFSGPAPNSESALPDIESDVLITGFTDLVFNTNEETAGLLRLLKVANGKLTLHKLQISGFGVSLGDGGAIEAIGASSLMIDQVGLINNSAAANGGAIAITDNAVLTASRCLFSKNFAGVNGGAISINGNASADVTQCDFSANSSDNNGGAINAEGSSSINIELGQFRDNTAGLFGCEIHVSSSYTGNDPALLAQGNQLSSRCSGPLIDNPMGSVRLRNNTFFSDTDIINSTDRVEIQGNVLHLGVTTTESLHDVVTPPHKQALCNDFGRDAFSSLGYNIASDNSCALDQATDRPGVDPMILADQNGLYQPQPGSPLIDSGSASTARLGLDEMVTLPCGYRDIAGTARPQDGNGDGNFECDIGALEVQGGGEVTAGHSGAFYNTDRNGEGTFVEILSETRALVYTFTYRPDGSGPAWFVGHGRINRNAIVIDKLSRPTGTSFGVEFDKDNVVRTPVGGMSLVFPDCAAAIPGGNVAYSGDAELGYEGLLTRATRLSHVTGCDADPAHENVGLSGSYYDPARDGEGVITQWLPDGRVLVAFFTYDQNNNQMWVLGSGRASGKSVTVNARYPSSFSPWGSDYLAADTHLSDWGTFTLEWTDCNSVNFDYASTVEGFGSASRDYVRLSTLQGTGCPGF